ncbi:hypothetical protein JTE90_003364 [Oedothorax gibbosus]|uniref:Uncharacterized protein n=1 Tax=Oedothorax gibbosus TaxID=931172 RepID=A0AAV6TYV4_9ARAC|nr:hypothetical protein JTE90_003364 [Oedothorax gibbosus]
MDRNVALPLPVSNTSKNAEKQKIQSKRNYAKLPKPKKAKRFGRAADASEKAAQLLTSIISSTTSECSLPPSNKKYKPDGKTSVHKKQMVFLGNMAVGQRGSSQVTCSKNPIVSKT